MIVTESFYKFCPYCRTTLQPRWDGTVERRTCARCGWTQYRNPTVAVAVVLLEERRLLLVQRPNATWCIPCGHVEWGESPEQAAAREFHEETGIYVQVGSAIAIQANHHDPERRTVGIWYRGDRLAGKLKPGSDACQAAFFSLDELPRLAFPTDRIVIQRLKHT